VRWLTNRRVRATCRVAGISLGILGGATAFLCEALLIASSPPLGLTVAAMAALHMGIALETTMIATFIVGVDYRLRRRAVGRHPDAILVDRLLPVASLVGRSPA